MLHTLLERYLADPGSGFARWLPASAEHEAATAIEPQTRLSWDYRQRMGDVRIWGLGLPKRALPRGS